jgi:O-antigen/teichoic acid export membrane protein
MTATTPVRARAAALAVPLALVGLAGSGYLALVAGGRALPASSFAGLSSFYLLANTVGRGTFAAFELELTRGVARALELGTSTLAVCRSALPRAGLLLGAVLLVLAATSPLLARAVGGGGAVLLLGASAIGLAASSFLRGPLAGSGRYGLFAASLAAEAVVVLGGALVLLLVGTESLTAWIGLLALSPLAGVIVVGGAGGAAAAIRATRPHAAVPAELATTVPALIWGSALFLCSQGVWNLAPVVATARADAFLDAAGGFAAVAVLLRAPVMAFPAIQALLLPRLSRAHVDQRGAGRSRMWQPGLVVAAVGGGALWMVLAIVLASPVVSWLFAIASTPSRGIVAVLAASILLGTIAQLGQAELLARGRSAAVALTWAAALAVLLVGSVLPIDPLWAAACGQLGATAVALTAIAVLLRRRPG